MSRINLEDNLLFNPKIMRGWRLQSALLVPADNHVFDIDTPPLVLLNPAGAVDILMPASSEAIAGTMFLMHNISASTITLKTSGDAAFTTAISIATLEGALVYCTGSATAALGWRALATGLSS